ncbi:hypothetical protein HY030_03455 [Candidatus Gottesmanbacteria bacterium]|nr:hypothetical protein [Candidatus Gottesmanbacteria bacterium]
MLGRIYNSLIRKHRDAVSFIILLFFLVAFLTSRTYIYLNTAGVIPDTWFLNRSIRGVHVHHLAFGIIILTISGYLALNFHNVRLRHFNAALYGLGLGLAYDEFGMWLRLQDNYWIRQSYDAVAVILVILINVVYFSSLWQRILLKTITLFLRLFNLRLLRLRRLMLPRQGRVK